MKLKEESQANFIRQRKSNGQISHNSTIGACSDRVRFDLDAIPPSVRDSLAEATLRMVMQIKKTPGGEECLAARTAARLQKKK